MSSRKTATRRGTTKKRAQRATSNVFAMFNQDQIQEFKEAFNMIDHNRSGAGNGTPNFFYVNM
jgi:myosin regulatory light chain 12